MKYRKKPVIIEAKQFKDYDNLNEILDFVGDSCSVGWCKSKDSDGMTVCINISTLEGEMQARMGDYIIKGVYF